MLTAPNRRLTTLYGGVKIWETQQCADISTHMSTSATSLYVGT